MAHRPPKRPGSQQTLHGFFAKRTCASSAAQSSDLSLEENSDHSEGPEIEVCSDSDLPQMESEVDSDDDGGTVSSSDASQERLPAETIADDDVVTVTNDVAGGTATQHYCSLSQHVLSFEALSLHSSM